ncbi:unnamed protein product [Rotaria socialis]|uniref:Uncharacterized protein n=1 Tax=Rotaria socialis TaxID=392032 RepID=A0A820YT13_9BILA|nr:unnamed protein product [Rotaria socialis]CAF3622202.1 unnamed protein product [Rotaria socialis]CAF4291556.1 unnamed protein product [Rotaria socialis]CAF4547409.1 unnamed protein product [Rotaria socialis]
MSKHHSNLKLLKLAGNFLFIAIAWTLFVLNIVKYATSYFQRTSYKVIEKPNGFFYIFKEIYENETQWESNCTSNYSKSEADNIFRWFIASKKSENIVFHVFYWFMMVIALTISLAPSISYVFKYFKSNHYNITERYCLSSMLHFIRTFFSITVFVLPSFYMNTFNFTSEPCLTAYPTTFSIDISPFIFATFIGLIIYFIFNLIVNFFYEKRRFCCSIECLSYLGLCILGLLIVCIVVFSATIIAFVFVISFIETSLRLTVILIVVQFPFLIVQLLSD